MGDYKNAIIYLEKSLKIYEEFGNSNHPETANLYSNIGLLVQNKGEYEKALAYFRKALEIRETNFGNDNSMVARTHLYMGDCYLEKLDFDQAKREMDTSLSIFNLRAKKNQREIAEVHNSLGTYYEKLGNYDEALTQFNKALTIDSIYIKENDPGFANYFARIGGIFLKKRNYINAKKQLIKAKDIELRIFGNKNANVAATYSQIALACPNQIDCIKENIALAYKAVNYSSNSSFEESLSPITLLKIMKAEGELFSGLYEINKKPEHLLHADSIFKNAISLIKFIKTSLEQPGSRLALQENFYQIYELAIWVKYQLKELKGQ